MMYAMVCKQFRKEEERFWFCQERCFVMPVSAKQIIPVTEGIRKEVVSKTSDFGSYPDRPVIALWCNWQHARL